MIAEAEAAYEAYLTVDVIDAFETFLEDLSNWYIRRSRRRFYSFDEAAFRTLWTPLVQALRVVAPVLPFLGEHLWQALVTGACPDAPASVHLAGWPARSERPGDEELLAEIAAVRDVVQLGRRARGEANLKLRQPLRRMYRARRERGCGARRGDRGGAARQGGRIRPGARRPRAAAAEPAPARAAARLQAAPGAGRAPARRRRRSSTTAGCARPARCSSPTR